MPAQDITLIRKNNSGSVTAYDDAVIFHSAIGDDFKGEKRGVVYAGIGNELGFSIVGGSVQIKSGMGQLYGRQFQIPSGKTVSVTAGGTQGESGVSIVYIEINCTTNPETIAVKVAKSTSPGIVPTVGNADIYKTPSAVATMPLFQFSYNGQSVSLANDLRNVRKPGVAESALSIPGEGIIYGNVVSNLIEEGNGYAKKARHADEADTSSKISGVAVSSRLGLKGNNEFLVVGIVNDWTLSSTLEAGSSVDLMFNQRRSNGLLLGYNIESCLNPYTRPSSSETRYASGFVGCTTVFYLTDEDTVEDMPATGIRYDQNDHCYAKVEVKSDRVTLTAIDRISQSGATVSYRSEIRFTMLYAGD